MAKPLRIEFDGTLYHVTSKGNAREPIFITDTNRALFSDKRISFNSKNKDMTLLASLLASINLKACLFYCKVKLKSIPIVHMR